MLSKVLRTGCISHPPHDGTAGRIGYTVTWNKHLEDETLIVPTVTCFADIPKNALSIHISKYGAFGVALSRSLLVARGARPVTYIPLSSGDWMSLSGRGLLRDIEAIRKGFSIRVIEPCKECLPKSRTYGKEPSTFEEAIAAVEEILDKEFLPFLKPFNSELSDCDADNFYMEREWRKYGNMKFRASDVTTVVVAKGYEERLLVEFPEYADRILPISI
ncbi:abortive infection system antitoxin AbiGi family protein [Solimonas fluminis]|uniref:abortive infection system antitoxin AbiGi family protein n=1 Tax=Solimonas fluminis TaxID=2086571 RepID=UPI001FB00E42|nr:abortive infection system antitoxin AbiGi family protein [Solimonas fluminis]